MKYHDTSSKQILLFKCKFMQVSNLWNNADINIKQKGLGLHVDVYH